MALNFTKLESSLISEYKYKIRVFNDMYANKELFGAELIKAKVCEAQVELLQTIITAIQEAYKED